MSRGDDLRVADIVEAAEQLAEIVAAGRSAFDEDWTRQRAAERLVEIIGEAANALSEDFKAKYPAVSWRHIGLENASFYVPQLSENAANDEGDGQVDDPAGFESHLLLET